MGVNAGGGQRRGAARSVAPAVAPAVVGLEGVQRLLEELGLRGAEVKVLLALVRLGTATPSELAALADVGRTSVYPVLEALRARRLAEPVPGAPGVWGTPGRDEILDRVYAAHEAHVLDLHERLGEARVLLAQVVPDGPATTLPFVHLIRDVTEVIPVWEKLLAETQRELMMFSRPPYAWTAGDVNQTVLDTLARDVSIRVMYESSLVEDPDVAAYRAEVEIYLDAGVVARVTEELPMKLEIFDRSTVLLSMANPTGPETGYPMTLLIEHPPYAAFQADAFEKRWAAAKPYPRLSGRASTANRLSRSSQ